MTAQLSSPAMTSTDGPQAPSSGKRTLLYRSIGVLPDLLISCVFGITAFVLVVVAVSLGIGLLVIGVGLFFLWALPYLLRATVTVERWRSATLYGTATPADFVKDPAGMNVPGLKGVIQRWWVKLKDPELLRGFARTAIAMILATLALTVIGGLGELTAQTFVALSRGYTGMPVTSNWIINYPMMFVLPVLCILGIALIVVLLALVMPAIDRELLSASTRDDLEYRVHSLDTARSGAVAAAEDQRVRIERDLHDGVQPQLVSVAMNIDMARRALANNPDQASAMLDEAHTQSKDAITSLRHTVQGIRPSVLTDRGLDAALSALAARSPIATDINVDLPQRPSSRIEGTLYFAVAEAMTNIARHAQARTSQVTITQDQNQITTVVWDDGVGGAAIDHGPSHTGLRGMRDRLTAVGGTLTVASPQGGPTIVKCVVPCA